jgi:CrcB protein
MDRLTDYRQSESLSIRPLVVKRSVRPGTVTPFAIFPTMQGINGFLVVFAGAGLGGAMRHGVNLLSARLFTTPFPVGTFAVNVVGSLALGILAGYFTARGRSPDGQWLLLATGILGGFTTFSAFSLDAVTLWNRGQGATAAWFVAGSVAVSLVALAAGLRLGARIF